jgi:mono/diheme cytochrome c family protein
MKLTILMASGILLTPIFVLSAPSAMARELEVVAGGELEYQSHCAVCHGFDASGTGIMSKYLTLPPANLTQLSKKYGGKFPFWEFTAPSTDAKKCPVTA